MLGVVLAGSCVPAERDDVALGRAAIIEGTPAPDDPAVVAITFAGDNLVCTGTLIGPRVVLSAAHCAIDTALEVHLGPQIGAPEAAIPVVAARTAPSFAPATLDADIALFVLARPAPESIVPARLLQRPLRESDIGAPIRFVGFGRTHPDETFPRVKNEGRSTILGLEDETFHYEGGPRACVGDSGGPVFLEEDGTEWLAGITRSGTAGCIDRVHNTRLDRHRGTFIDPFLAALAEGAAAPGERCFYDAHCSLGRCEAPADAPSIAYCSAPCASDADCPAAMRCDGSDGAARLCRYPSPSPGAPGTGCSTHWECEGGLCAAERGTDARICAEACTPSVPECGAREACLPIEPSSDTAETHGCFPGGGGGCHVATDEGEGPRAWLLSLVCCWLGARGRRRSTLPSRR